MVKVAVVQLNAARDRETNVNNALRLIDEAADRGAKFVMLPEYSTFLGDYPDYTQNAEPVPGLTSEKMSDKAHQRGIYLHAGSLIELSPVRGKFYNTSLVFDPQGNLIASYRKIHLFDIDVPEEVTETESSTVLPGDRLVLVKLPDFKLGMSICFDLRFPEIYRQLALCGAEVLGVPSAFARATGQVHWEILLRARAIENHAFVLAADQFGQDALGHWCYGHSMIVDPWGRVLCELPDGEGVLVADIDINQVYRRRNQIPVLKVRHPEVYVRVDEKP